MEKMNGKVLSRTRDAEKNKQVVTVALYWFVAVLLVFLKKYSNDKIIWKSKENWIMLAMVN